jgi:hypothetical protein
VTLLRTLGWVSQTEQQKSCRGCNALAAARQTACARHRLFTGHLQLWWQLDIAACSTAARTNMQRSGCGQSAIHTCVHAGVGVVCLLGL